MRKQLFRIDFYGASMTILVSGATGTLGRHVVAELLRKGERVRALSRHPEQANLPAGVEVVGGDLTAPDSLSAAFDGVGAVHLLSASGHDHLPLETGAEIVELAGKAGVRRATILAPDQDGTLARAMVGSDLEWTRVWPVDFMANALGWAPAIKAEALVAEPYGGRRTAGAHEGDVAAVIAKVLVEGGHAGREYKITGPQALTPADKVRAIAAATGREVRFQELADDQARELWRGQGWPEEGIDFMLQMWATVPADVAEVTTAVEQITGRPARTFAQWAVEHAAEFADLG
jgi:uncharacterized protein YbjT (DUF2867 family)